VGLPQRRQRHSGRNFGGKNSGAQPQNQKFGPKNISLQLNAAGWSILLGKKLFGFLRVAELIATP
jgi:hypothetical protein